ncbi:hypothetical protein PMAA_030890 [Talaromyces marneffei ATCC 18224]|uniref:Carrier domain-containing protein n=1 Tax=Talaromyces marneffei (strain ATCC 18224 / CBS 334.59 / QM 7333) TaxID=441960 RepID=B6Q4G7_TALMQ|nr:hypothetical protein PMAA_030890 [Talaromyces marneffei ATCC 18224]
MLDDLLLEAAVCIPHASIDPTGPFPIRPRFGNTKIHRAEPSGTEAIRTKNLNLALTNDRKQVRSPRLRYGLEGNSLVGVNFSDLTTLCVSGGPSLKDTIIMAAGRTQIIQNTWSAGKDSTIAVEGNLADLFNTHVRVWKEARTINRSLQWSKKFHPCWGCESDRARENTDMCSIFSSLKLQILNVTKFRFHPVMSIKIEAVAAAPNPVFVPLTQVNGDNKPNSMQPLRLEPHEIKDDTDLVELSINSLMGMELAQEVQAAFKCALDNIPPEAKEATDSFVAKNNSAMYHDKVMPRPRGRFRNVANSPIDFVWIEQAKYFFEQLVSRLPAGNEALRILEMGGGTGGTTSNIVPLLARLKVPVFKVVNINITPDPKLLHNQRIFLATNCVHATRDLSVSLSSLSVFIEGWWLFEDGRNHALSPATYWEKVLRSVRYDHVEWTEENRPESEIQRVIMTHASERRSENRELGTSLSLSLITTLVDSLRKKARVSCELVSKYIAAWKQSGFLS